MALTQIDINAIQSTAVNTLAGPKIANVQIANSAWSVLDDTAVDTAGGYIIINGSGFTSGCSVVINTTTASAVSFVSSSVLRVTVPALAAATYNIFVVNPDGDTAIGVNALTYSGFPSWVTSSPLADGRNDVAYSLSFNATGATSYSLQAGSTLPTGFTLAANGLLSGTVTGLSNETTYSFTVEATDAQNQDSPRTFSLTITIVQNKLYSWGRASQGLNLTGVDVYRSNPAQVGTDTNWSLISASDGQFAAFIRGDGTLWTTGNNNNGQLGQNNRVNQSSPTQVGSGTNWSWVSSSSSGMIAVKTNGTLWTWGGSNFGFSGLSTTLARSSPTQVGSLTDWSRVSAGTYNVVAIKTDGTLWAWGLNNYGQLGQNDQIHRSSPVQVGSGTNWSNAAITDGHMLAVKTDGTLWGAGQNDDGQLGRNNNWTFTMSSPVQIGSDTNWSDVSISRRVSFAIKTTGTLWSWGYNESGGLGQNDRTQRSSPVQVGAATDWSRVSVGVNGSQYSSVLAVKTNKTLWSWGENSFWQLGQNNNISRSSPVQVGSATDWNLVSIRGYVSLATTI